MPRISKIEVLRRQEQPILYITQTLEVKDLPEAIGNGFRRLGEYLKEKGECPADIPLVSFQGTNPKCLRIGVIFPMATPTAGYGDIESSFLPAGDYIFCMYQGPYEEITAVYEEMYAWLVDRGFPHPDMSYEQYFNGQEYLPEQYLTRITMPLGRNPS